MAFQYDRNGKQSYLQIIAAAKKSGINLTPTSTIGGTHVAGSWHYTGNAVDFSNGTDTPDEAKFAQWIMDNYGKGTGELIHSGGKGYYLADGAVVPASYYAKVLKEHHSHVHWAITLEGLAAGGGVTDNSGGGGGILGAITDPLLAPIKALVDFAGQIVKLFKFFTDPHNWFRIAEFILGCGLLYLGLKGLNSAAFNAVARGVNRTTKKIKTNTKRVAGKAKDVADPPETYAPKKVSDTARRSAKIEAVKRGQDVTPLAGDAIPNVSKGITTAIKDTVG